ncbi:MAG: SDR family NAD(P)-dependent oxidoreductase [Nitratireductor sp.]
MAGRNIIITGGTSGIGAELVRRYIGRHNVLIVGRSPSEEIQSYIDDVPTIFFVEADLSSPQKASELIEKKIKALKWEGVSNAILNAGIGFVGNEGFESAENIRKTLSVNLTSNIAISQMLFPYLQAGKGKLTLIGSTSYKGQKEVPSYAASKAALHGLARSLGQEWGGRVDVQIIHPGPTNTPMHEKAGLKLGFIKYLFTEPRSMAAMIDKTIASRRVSAKLSFFHDWAGSTILSRGLK